MSTQPHSAEHGVPLWGMLDRLIRLKGCSGWPKTNPSNDKNTPRALAIDWREVQTLRLASPDLLGFASRLRNESGHNPWFDTQTE